jgi:hypothetical protein
VAAIEFERFGKLFGVTAAVHREDKRQAGAEPFTLKSGEIDAQRTCSQARLDRNADFR